MSRHAGLSGWGRFPRVDAVLRSCGDAGELAAALTGNQGLIPRGNGRAYGDAAINPELTVSMLRLDRLLDFDPDTGMLVCESGVLLADIIDVLAPRGWFPPVVPGTKWVTVGGMAAADIHGKNHHVDGSFGRHVVELQLMTSDGGVVTCSRDREPALFDATLGGMGLTGFIMTVTFRLRRISTAWLQEETLYAADATECVALLDASSRWPYCVAWLDCSGSGDRFGRGLVMRARHAEIAELPATTAHEPLSLTKVFVPEVPFDLPAAALNRRTVGLFNAFYLRWGARRPARLVDLDRYFFQLDAIADWPRLYGRRGLVQYQCVLPRAAGVGAVVAFLDRVRRADARPYLAVLKALGPEAGPLSFAMDGYTLALDFPVRESTLALFRELDGLVVDHGGRIYLAKDACTTAVTVIAGYPRLDEFREVRALHGAKFHSGLSRRLEL